MRLSKMTDRSTPLPLTTHSRVVNKLLASLCRSRDFPTRLRLVSILERVTGETRIVAPTNFGMLMALDKADLVQREILFTEGYEPELTRLLLANLTPQDVFYDVGANVGYYTMLAVSLGVQVHAFEPDPLSFAMVGYNLELNSQVDDLCIVVQRAVGAEPGREIFKRANVANTGISGFGEVENITATFPVEVVSLDSYIEQGDEPPPTVMKVDVEGWESNVFMGAANLLSQSPPRLIVFEGKCDPQGRLHEPEIESILGHHGYRIQHLPRTHGQIESRENYVAFHSAALPVMP